MTSVRDFSRADVPQVADLWLKVFQHREPPASSALKSYFEEMFLDHPWRAQDISSLVYEDASGSIVAFLGVLPREMTFQGQPVRVAVSSQFMVDTTSHRGNAAIELMRRFLAGSQDLSLTDGATEGVRRIWEAARGEFATLYSCAWTRILRPGAYLLESAKGRKSLRLPASLAQPFTRLLDPLLTRMPHSPYRAAAVAPSGIEATEETLLGCIAGLPARYALRPRYDVESLRWTLQKAAEAKTRGNLRRIVVQDSQGVTLGWYIYYAKQGGTSKVLQIGAGERNIRDVIHHLFYDAWDQGSAAVSGRLEPRFARELSLNHCGFNFHNVAVLIHSRHPDILNTIHRGAACLTRLEGEWWMRFHEEEWL